VPTIVSLSVVLKTPFAKRIAEIDKNIAREFLQGRELTNATYDVLMIVNEYNEAAAAERAAAEAAAAAAERAEAAAERAERAEIRAAAEREAKRTVAAAEAAAERADARAAAERADARAAAERAERAEDRAAAEAAEKRKHELEAKKIVASRNDVSFAGSCTTSELAEKTPCAKWEHLQSTSDRVALSYTDATEATVQAEMVALLGPVGEECGLKMADTHLAGVPGLHKPDLVFSLLSFVLNVLTALAVGVVVELKARRPLNDAAVFGGFTQDHVGQLIDKLARLRRVRVTAVLYGICSNGFHVQYFMLSGQGLFKSDVCTLADRGMLKHVLCAARDSLVGDFQFLNLVAKQLPPTEWQIKSLLGAGSHCRAWEMGQGNLSLTLVVAETDEGRAHLRHNYDVFTELREKASAQLDVLLYTPMWIESSQRTTVAAFQQCGVRWSQSMMHLLTRGDVDDIIAQLEFMHRCGFIHGDVATRNFVRFTVDGVARSVLIDAGSATKSGDAWRGGTVFNASVAWLESNLHRIEDQRSQVQPGTVQDDLWAFVFALCDMRSVHWLQRDHLIAHRQQLVTNRHIAEIGEHVEKCEYALVARKVSDLLFLPGEAVLGGALQTSPVGVLHQPAQVATTPVAPRADARFFSAAPATPAVLTSQSPSMHQLPVPRSLAPDFDDDDNDE
jgi:hypothetical protein